MLLLLVRLKRWFWPMIESSLLFDKTRSLGIFSNRERLLLNLFLLSNVKVIAMINMLIIVIVHHPWVTRIDRNSRMFGYEIIISTRWLVVKLFFRFLWCHVIIVVVVILVIIIMIKIVLLLILLTYRLILLVMIIILVILAHRLVNYSRLLDWILILILVLVMTKILPIL